MVALMTRARAKMEWQEPLLENTLSVFSAYVFDE